ncbi:hypothetical protein PHMEG_00016003 [Phytophthora megakarya]|uniref:Uncharacterized protein n=1 Tax=Phytophthora megakarya TaxID=4795 RepID=A0A225W0B4_9STRA|nr:hypothetical protein PHMEG_00016003 [Phytophthora megakarya]
MTKSASYHTDILYDFAACDNKLLKRLGCKYTKGEKRHYLAESVRNVAYRVTYLQWKLQNRDRNNNPIRPEVYLAES